MGGRPVYRRPARAAPRRSGLAAQHFLHRRPDRRGRWGNNDAGALQRRDLVGGAALAAGDDRAGMTHAPPGRRGAAGNEADDRLFAPRGPEKLGRLLLAAAADLADHDDRLGLVVGEEHLQDVDKARAVDRIAADADAAAAMDMARHDADLALVRGDDAGAVRPDQPRAAAAQAALDRDHVEDRDALGDADDERHPGVGRFEDRVGGKGRRHVDDAGVAPCHGARLGDRVEDRQVEMARAAFARGHAADHLGAVGDRLLGMERALGAGEALAEDLCGGADEDRHQDASLTAATILCAASARFSAARIGSPDCRSNFLPRSTLVPSRRTTKGTCRLTSRAAETTPSAITSQRMMPPKMLTNIPSTFGSERMILNAAVTRSLVAP